MTATERRAQMTDYDAFRKRLLAREQELVDRLSGIERELDEPADPDFEERSVERESDEVLEKLGDAGRRELRLIHAALRRIDEGGYGVCTSCGEPISAERLRTVPEAARCRRCA